MMDWVEAPRQTLAWAHVHKLAELTHPHVLPLLGMSQDYRKFVYEAMPVSALLDNHGAVLPRAVLLDRACLLSPNRNYVGMPVSSKVCTDGG